MMRILKLVRPRKGLASLSRAAFPMERHPYLIHCQPGYDDFATAHLAWPMSVGRTYWVALGDQDELAGFAEIRSVGEFNLLNHIAVHPSHQGKGLASAMMEAATDGWSSGARLALDVFSESRARGFYQSLGFRPIEKRAWLIDETPLPKTGIDFSSAAVTNAPEFFASMRTFGFGHLDVTSHGITAGRALIASSSVARLEPGDPAGRTVLKSAVLHVVPSVKSWVEIVAAAEAGIRIGGHVRRQWESERLDIDCDQLRTRLRDQRRQWV